MAFSGEIVPWRGPAPHHFVEVPERHVADLRVAAAAVTYGWGVVPVAATIGTTTWTTSLFPKDGGYLVPIKASVRRAEGLEVGDTVGLLLVIDA